MPTIGVLLTNTGTPDAPTPAAVKRYLREFLSDPRIVHLPRMIWLPILYGLILPTRSHKSAKLYEKIWTPDGAPMRTLMQRLATQLEKKLQNDNVKVAVGMNYGNPSIQQGLETLTQQSVDNIIVLPLFPQYSNTTTASSFDHVAQALQSQPFSFDFSFIHQYATHPAYIRALAANVTKHWDQQPRADHLLISFHGIPERFVQDGDPYATQCQHTAQQLAQALQLSADQWTLCYQSQFGYDRWLKPSTQQLLQTLPQRGIHSLDIVCPGFSIDCLETLEELLIRGKQVFQEAGGRDFHYIPALNDTDLHADTLTEILALSL